MSTKQLTSCLVRAYLYLTVSSHTSFHADASGLSLPLCGHPITRHAFHCVTHSAVSDAVETHTVQSIDNSIMTNELTCSNRAKLDRCKMSLRLFAVAALNCLVFLFSATVSDAGTYRHTRRISHFVHEYVRRLEIISKSLKL